MVVYADLVMGLNFTVDLLLLYGARKLSGSKAGAGRLPAAAAMGAGYAGVCLIPAMSFLGNPLWRMVSLALMSAVAFGMNRIALRAGALFGLLSMTLGGLAVCFHSPTPGALLLLAVAVAVCCGLWMQAGGGKRGFATVRVRYNGRENRFLALKDTGNTLCDPVTGEGVLVAGADVALTLLGLTQGELNDPVGTMASGKYRGLRLIPYRTVGQTGGMMLGMCLDEVWIDGERAGRLVAFAPQILGKQEGYQALTGG